MQWTGTMNWCICGCNVCATGQMTGGGGGTQTTKPINVSGCCSSACGTRTICITSISF